MKNRLTEGIAFRVEPEFAELLLNVTCQRGEDISDFIRRAVKVEDLKREYKDDRIFLEYEANVCQYASSLVWKNLHHFDSEHQTGT